MYRANLGNMCPSPNRAQAKPPPARSMMKILKPNGMGVNCIRCRSQSAGSIRRYKQISVVATTVTTKGTAQKSAFVDISYACVPFTIMSHRLSEGRSKTQYNAGIYVLET